MASFAGNRETDNPIQGNNDLAAPNDAAMDNGGDFASEPTVSLARQRTLVIVFVLVLVALTARVISWTLPVAAQTGHPTPLPAEPMRGRIVDRHGLLMATDTFVGEVYANPAKIAADTKRRPGVEITTSLTLGRPIGEIQATLATTSSLAVLTQSATVQQCEDLPAKVKATDLVWCDFARQRAYPQGAVAAHVLGFVNVDHLGLYGVEARYDSWLNSGHAWPGALPGAASAIPADWRLYLPSPAGRDLVLNLDVPLQYVVERRLQEAVARYQAEAGTIIMMDPRTGAVLAMANYPTFDPGQYSAVNPNTWVNPAISEIYEPGSVFKLITMAAGLDSGYITPDSTFLDSGSLPIGGRVIKNAEQRAYGNVTIREALAHSINVISAQVSLRMGAETFYKYVRQFGFSKITEVDLQSEVPGIVKQPGKGGDWSEYDLAANSFGQGISVTAFQMVNAAAAIANGGVLLQPQIAQSMVQDGTIHALSPRILTRPIKPETARAMTKMMVYTVAQSSTPDPVPGFTVAGKTGTAEVPTKEGYTSLQGIHSFIGFLPAADPQLIVMVKLVKPKTALWAEQTALPTFARVGQDAVQMLELKPDNRKP